MLRPAGVSGSVLAPRDHQVGNGAGVLLEAEEVPPGAAGRVQAAGDRAWTRQDSGVSGTEGGVVHPGWVPELPPGGRALRRQEESHEDRDHLAASRVPLRLLRAKDR